MICRACGHPKSEHKVNLHGGWSCQHREMSPDGGYPLHGCLCTTVLPEPPPGFPSYFYRPRP